MGHPEERDEASFALENFLPYRLSLLSNTVSEGIARAYRKAHDLTVTEWRVIAVLGRFPGETASQIVDRTAMDKVTVSRAVRKLLERGVVERSPVEQDRRRQALRLTRPKGWHLFRTIVPQALAYERRLLDTLDIDEQASLQGLLDKLQARARELHDP